MSSFVRRLVRAAAPLAAILAPIPVTGLTASRPASDPAAGIRPPATPLIVRGPYVSVWLPADTLPGTWPAFWNGTPKAITGIARIDGVPYVFMGAPSGFQHAMIQKALRITPTQSRFTLTAGGIVLRLDFLSPVDARDLRRLSMPFGYLFAQITNRDARPHTVSLYLDISGEWADSRPGSPITWRRYLLGSGARDRLTAFAVSPARPQVLREVNEYPAWSTAVFACEDSPSVTSAAGPDAEIRREGATAGRLDGTIDANMPRAVSDHWPVFAYDADLGTVPPGGTAPREPLIALLGCVRNPAVSYMGTPVPPLWQAYWPDWQHMVAFAYSDAPGALARAGALDRKITRSAMQVGGPRYAALCALALRQAFGGTELVGTAEHPWLLLKEISSDGNVSTVDVVYPAFPAFLYANPRLLRLLLDPLLSYAETGGWPKPFAEHDLGSSYPNASGHNDGREEDMPVEESANMLIMVAAYLNRAPKADAADYARRHYAILEQWTAYEEHNGLDPAYQNQTDDFTGFIKSSANLALKAILGVGAMAQIAGHAGRPADALAYARAAREMMAKWALLAQSSSGTHLVLAYGQNATWSLKYNAFADRLLNLRLIPQRLLQEEDRYYMQQENPFGIPLDGRHTYTKTDWEMWTAAAVDDPRLRSFIIDSIYRFADSSGFRGALTDWYDTVSGGQVGFVARPVIGGVFAPMLVARNSDATPSADAGPEPR